MHFLNCIVYMTILGILCFPAGRLFARINFHTDKFPFRQTEYEKNGILFDKLKIHKWQSKVPDISRIFSKIVPKKQINNTSLNSHHASTMVNETCVAELTHVLLIFWGIPMLFIWPGVGGAILLLIYIFLGNIPFILIQRYNRPRLVKMRDSLIKRELRKFKDNGENLYAGSNTQLQ